MNCIIKLTTLVLTGLAAEAAALSYVAIADTKGHTSNVSLKAISAYLLGATVGGLLVENKNFFNNTKDNFDRDFAKILSTLDQVILGQINTKVEAGVSPTAGNRAKVIQKYKDDIFKEKLSKLTEYRKSFIQELVDSGPYNGPAQSASSYAENLASSRSSPSVLRSQRS